MYPTIRQSKFTQCQVGYLIRLNPGEIVKDISILRKLAKLELVSLHEHTGEIVRHVWGMNVRTYYIDDAETFEIAGVGIFRRRFFDGCFMPFLVKNKALQQ